MSTAWLNFDEASDGLITITSTDVNDVMYVDSIVDTSINPNQYPGHRVVIDSFLNYYPTITAQVDFYVKITECIITDFYLTGASQASFNYVLYSGALSVPIVSYT